MDLHLKDVHFLSKDLDVLGKRKKKDCALNITYICFVANLFGQISIQMQD